MAVILDERTRRPIPIPRWDGLTPGDNQRKRLDKVTAGAPVENRQLIPAAEIRVNTIAVSGIVPSRLDQPNGGIPNFLRLNELWDNVNLFFGGSMIELNYSTSATATLYQQSFEPPVRQPFPAAQQLRGFDYYFPPNRRFGYDVALQIARSISPVSARFEFPSSAVSEFLRDIQPQDPYVRRVRCALQTYIADNPDGLPADQLPELDPSAELPDPECDPFS
ncbi:MAG: hypothetical protein HC924_11370 [Synechococcaceae cyanobacterium SM2_3_2]|nr:hypothetical protein [Synechococcaceae cyanobacterium SM2_3_2]